MPGGAEEVAPCFLQKPQLHQEGDGNVLIFECQILAHPRPEVTWHRGESLLAEDLRTRVKVRLPGAEDFSFVKTSHTKQKILPS